LITLRFPAGKSEQLAGQIGRGLRGLKYLFRVFPSLSRQRFLVKQTLAATKDHHQEVVEIVRDSTRKQPKDLDSLPPLQPDLCLAKGFFRLPALGDVLNRYYARLRAPGTLPNP
jgi:hypothetical protein